VGLKRLLFICSKNRWRSPTAEAIFSEYQQIEADSAGLDSDAEVCVSGEALQRADTIFVMEQSHRSRLTKRFRPSQRKTVNIPGYSRQLSLYGSRLSKNPETKGVAFALSPASKMPKEQWRRLLNKTASVFEVKN
jgi:predicted protein tyrosine phosphatase